MAILAGDALFTLAIQTLSRIEGLDAGARGGADSRTFLGVGHGGRHDRRPGDRYRRRAADADGRIAGSDSSRQDRRAAARQRADGRDLRGRRRGADRGAFRYGEHVGLAFQIVDDILDVEESSEALGKTAGKDAAQGKITFPGGIRAGGIARAWRRSNAAWRTRRWRRSATRAQRLHEIADLIVHRKS